MNLFKISLEISIGEFSPADRYSFAQAVLKAVRVEIRVSGDKSNKLLIVHLGLEIVIVL